MTCCRPVQCAFGRDRPTADIYGGAGRDDVAEPVSLFETVRHRIEDGDQLLFRNPFSPIAFAIGSPYAHAAMAAYRSGENHDTLCCVESRQFKGGRVVTLHSQVQRYPGRIDVWRPKCPRHIRSLAAQYAFDQAGHEYNLLGIGGCGLNWLPDRLGIKPDWLFDVDDLTLSKWDEAKFCSQQNCFAYRKAALYHEPAWADIPEWDPCPGRGDAWCWPGHLANDSFELLFPRLTLEEHAHGQADEEATVLRAY